MGGIVSTILLVGEKLSLWCTCTTLVCCLMITLVIVLGFGIGLGYNYCLVDMMTRYRYVPERYRPIKHSPTPHVGPNIYYTTRHIWRMDLPPETITDKISRVEEIPHTLETSDLPSYTNSDKNDVKDILLPKETSVQPSLKFSGDRFSVEEILHPIATPNSRAQILNRGEFQVEEKVHPIEYNDDKYHVQVIPNPTEIVDFVTPRYLSSSNVVTKAILAPKKSVVPMSVQQLLHLLSAIRADNKNYTLQIITH